ncbi:hypothetical protein [Streptomyces sp. NPDC054834]
MTSAQLIAYRKAGGNVTADDLLNAMERSKTAEAEAADRYENGQISREALAGMNPAEIVSAKRDGLLDALLGRKSA